MNRTILRGVVKGIIRNTELIIFFTGLFFGMMLFIIFKEFWLIDSGLFGMENFTTICRIDVDVSKYSSILVNLRVKELAFLALIITAVRKKYVMLMTEMFCGALLGIVSSILIYKYEFWGVLLLASLIFPHTLFYYELFRIMMNKKNKDDKSYNHKELNITIGWPHKLLRRIICVVEIILLFLMGIASELYVSPKFLKQIVLYIAKRSAM